MFHSMLVWFFRACTLKKVACICQECYDFTLKPQIINGCMPSSLQSGTLSLQTGAGRKRCDLHVSRSANCDAQFANWYSLQIGCASSATSLQTKLFFRPVCKLRPSLRTVLRSNPVYKLGAVCRLRRCANCAQHIHKLSLTLSLTYYLLTLSRLSTQTQDATRVSRCHGRFYL